MCSYLFSVQYHCGGGGIVKLVPCLRGRKNISESVDKAREYAQEGFIDPLENLKVRKHYLHHGTRDVIINVGKFLLCAHGRFRNFSPTRRFCMEKIYCKDTFFFLHLENGVNAYNFFKHFSDNVKFHQSDANHAVVRMVVCTLPALLFTLY